MILLRVLGQMRPTKIAPNPNPYANPNPNKGPIFFPRGQLSGYPFKAYKNIKIIAADYIKRKRNNSLQI